MNCKQKNICIVVGARPNFMKVAPLIRAIEKSNAATYQLVYAGTENDPTLETTLFDDLQMPQPNHYLGVVSNSLNDITAQVMGTFDSYLETHKTDVVIVVDDLASTMAAAITAKKRGVKLAHLVAGTRSFDINMPKEINRLVIDALSDFLFTAGVKSNSIATREQGETSQTFMVGNILMDSLRHASSRLVPPALLSVSPREYIVLTLNRRALLNDKEILQQTLLTLERCTTVPVIAPLRWEARKAVSNALSTIHSTQAPEEKMSRIQIVDPLRYLEFAWLTANAKAIITDSGNVAEEATFNGVPCITLNDYTEHRETVTVGTNELVGADQEKLAAALDRVARGEWKQSALPERWDGRAAERIVSILTSF